MEKLAARRGRCVLLAAGTIVVGLVWRLVPLGLPPYLFKYGGSALWAAMVYWVVAAVAPHRSRVGVALLAFGVAALVELSRLPHSAGEDAFRLTLAGRLLLGRVFSVWDIAVYWVAIAAVAALDVATSRQLYR